MTYYVVVQLSPTPVTEPHRLGTNIAGRKFLAAVTAISLQQLCEFTPQAIKDTLWAMATIGYTPAKAFLQGAADLCLRLISQFNPQNIANAIWAFAKFGFNPGRYAVSANVIVPLGRVICELCTA